MTRVPEQRTDVTPELAEDPIVAAERITRDLSKKNSPEWLAAMQLLADQGDNARSKTAFSDLEKEMQNLKGMSEV